MWYTVSLLLKSRHLNQPSEQDWLWEESIVLVQAENEDDARRAGERIGKSKELEYVSATGDQVRWTFETIESVCEILDDTITSGTEVFSRFLRNEEVDSILTPFPDDAEAQADGPIEMSERKRRPA
jgi:Domain of unknown function (DUF4288)